MARKKILRVFIIIILAVFLASTALMSVMYLSGARPQDGVGTGENLTGETMNTGTALDENLTITGNNN